MNCERTVAAAVQLQKDPTNEEGSQGRTVAWTLRTLIKKSTCKQLLLKQHWLTDSLTSTRTHYK